MILLFISVPKIAGLNVTENTLIDAIKERIAPKYFDPYNCGKKHVYEISLVPFPKLKINRQAPY